MLAADAPPPEGDAACGATRSGLPSIRDLGSLDAAPRNPWNSAPPTDADIAGARRKKRTETEEGGGGGVARRACCARDNCWCGRFARSRGRIPSSETTGTGLYGKETSAPGPTGVSKVNAPMWTLSMHRGGVCYSTFGAGSQGSGSCETCGVCTRCGRSQIGVSSGEHGNGSGEASRGPHLTTVLTTRRLPLSDK